MIDTLTEASETHKRLAREFAQSQVAASVDMRDRNRQWDARLFRKMGAAGFLGAPFAEELGGQDASILDAVLMQEGFGEGAMDAGLALAWGVHTFLCGMPISAYAPPELQQRYLLGISTGEHVGAFASAEDHSGTEIAIPRTQAVRTSDQWVLDGQKSWVINAPIADFILVTATTGPDFGPDGISLFLVDRRTPGVDIGPGTEMQGLCTLPVANVTFTGCAVPHDCRLNAPAPGESILKRIAQLQRTCVFAHWQGVLQAVFDQSKELVREGSQFDRPIKEVQSVRTRLADMQIALAISRERLYRAALFMDQASPNVNEAAALAKFSLVETTQEVMQNALQIHGASGLVSAHWVERIQRDAMTATQLGGSNENLRSVIASKILNLG